MHGSLTDERGGIVTAFVLHVYLEPDVPLETPAK